MCLLPNSPIPSSLMGYNTLYVAMMSLLWLYTLFACMHPGGKEITESAKHSFLVGKAIQNKAGFYKSRLILYGSLIDQKWSADLNCYMIDIRFRCQGLWLQLQSMPQYRCLCSLRVPKVDVVRVASMLKYSPTPPHTCKSKRMFLNGIIFVPYDSSTKILTVFIGSMRSHITF